MEENNQDYIGMLWKKASENGYKQNEDYLRDKLMNDEEYRRLFHEKIQSQGYKPDYNEFSSRLGLEQQVQQPAPRVDVSDVEAQQQPESTILPENVGVDELRKRRQSIQTELDSDTEMNPMTISQRKLYEQQLKDIDRDIDKELHAKYDFSIENATAMKERNEALGAEVEKVLASANKDLQEMEAEHNGIGTRYTRQQYDRLVKLMMSDPDKAIRKLEDPDDPFSRLKLTKEEVDGLKSLAEERKKGREYMEEYAKTEEYRQQFLPMLEEEENKRKEQKSALVDEYSNYTVEKLKESIQSGDFSRYFTPVSMKDGKPKLTLDWLMPGTSLVKDLLWDRNQSEMLYAMHNIEQASKEADMERRRLEGKDIPVVTGLLHGVDWRGLNPLVDLRDATVQLGLSQKTKNGEELSGLEQEVMQTLDDKAKADMLYGNNYTVWDRLGTQLPEQLMFTLSFILSGGITGATEAGEKVAAKAALKAAARRAERGATGKFGTFVAEKVVPKTLGMATGATIQTFASPISWPSIAADFEKRYAGDVYYDKDGNLHVFDNGVSAPKALYQAAASAWIENFTEFAGENITKTSKLVDSKLLDVSGAVDDLMKKTGMKRIYDVVSNPIPGNLGKLAQKGSNLEEFSEEILGSIMNTLFATDQKAGQSYSESVKESVSNAFSQDQLLETFLSCTLTGMVLGGGGMARNAIATRDQRKAINRQVETSRAILSKVNGIDIDELDNQIENSEIKDLSKWMKQQSDANGWSADEQGAVISYVLGKTQQTMMRFNDESAIQQEMEELRKEAESMRNIDDGTIYNAMWDDGSGTAQPVNIVSGRVKYSTNEDGSLSFDPYTSSGMMVVRLPDGTMKQVSSRSIKSLESQTTVDELLEAQGNTVPQAMRRQFEEDGMAVPTVESVWGGAPMPGVTALNNGKLVYIGNDNGEYVFSNKDEATKKDMPEVRLSERQMVEIGLGAKIDDAIARGDMEAKLEADNDIDFLRKMDEASEEVTEKKMWDYVTHLAASRVKTDVEGNVVFEDGNVGAYAAYLLARSNGAHDVAMAEIRKAIEARQAQLALVETVQGIDPDGNITSLQATTAEAMDHLLAIDFYQKALRNLEQKKASDENVQAAAVSEAEEDRNEEVANTPVSQMEVGQQFPVQWKGQPAMATVMGKDADGRSVVTVRDMEGEDIEAGIDDWSDQQWESVRQKPQTDEQAPQQAPQPTPVQPTPTPQEPAPAAPSAAQPVPQNETPEPTPQQTPTPVQPEAAPQQEQPQAEYPKDKQGKPQYDQIDDPNVFALALVDEWGEDALGALDDIIEDTKEGLEQKSKLEQRRINKRLAMLEAVRGMLQPQEETSGNQGGISPNPTVEEVPAEPPTAETSVEQPVAETPQEETQPEQNTFVGYHTPVKEGREKQSQIASTGLPSGYYIALDKPFESDNHDSSRVKRVSANVGNVYDPEGLIGEPTEDLSDEFVVALQGMNVNPLEIGKYMGDAMTEVLKRHGYDAMVHNIDGEEGNRELIVFDESNVEEAPDETPMEPAGEGTEQTGEQPENNINNEQTGTDTEAVASQAEAVASQAESDAENITTEQQGNEIAAAIDEQLDKVNEQLALLGYYKADTEDESQFHESYGFSKTAEKKAVKDMEKLARKVAKDLGIEVGSKKLAYANIAPAGGEVYFKLPLSEGKELHLWIGLYHPGVNNGGYYNDDLEMDWGVFRIEQPAKSGIEKYGHNNNFESDITYDRLISDIKYEVRRVAPEFEIKENEGQTDTQPVSQVINKKPKKKSEKAKKTEKADVAKTAFKLGDEVMYKEYRCKVVDVYDNGTVDLEYPNALMMTVRLNGISVNDLKPVGEAALATQQTEQPAEATPTESAYGANNKLVSTDQYEELKRRMKEKLRGQANAGFDPEILSIGAQMAVYHIEAGARKFADFAKRMIDDLGDAIRPYLKGIYNGARDILEEQAKELVDGMTPYDEVRAFDVSGFGKEGGSTLVEAAQEAALEGEIEKQQREATEKITEIAQKGKKDKEKSVSLPQTKTQENGLQRNDELRAEGLPADSSNGADNLQGESQEAGQESGRPDREGETGGLGRPRQGVHDGLRHADQLEQPTQGRNSNNNHAERGTDYAPKSVDARIEANIRAIELMQELIESGKQATPEQMAVLRQFSGWGGLGKAFQNTTTTDASKDYKNRLLQLLGDEAYEQANMSRNSAYYTPAEVIDTLWDIARAMGFKGGNVLEGSAGIGNIIGLMPTDMSQNSNIHAVEIDPTTGNILSLLYPDAQVEVQGFEATKVENGSVDLAITNVPFVTGLRVNDTTGDKDLSRKFHDIHDYCIAKNIRKLREGGIGIFITSNGTLDNSAKLREWIVSEGNSDVVGAFRMNNNTFGGTGVTSDIVVVRKRVNGKKSPNAIDVSTTSGERSAEYNTGDTKRDGTPIIKQLSMDYNKYFIEHPEQMAGVMKFGFEEGDTFRPTSKGLYPEKGKDQSAMLAEFVDSFNDKDWESEGQPMTFAEAMAVLSSKMYESLGEDVKEGSMLINKDGVLCIAQRGQAVPLELNDKKVKGHTKEECFKAYQGIKKALVDVLTYQTDNEDNKGLKPLLNKLNKAYDDFVDTYGYLHKNTAINFLKNDVDWPNIIALEKYSETGDKKGDRVKTYGKTDVFTKRVVEKEKAPEPQNVKDGVIASIYLYGRIDVPYLSQQLGKSEAEIKDEIVKQGLGFENPTTREMEVSYEYLSGNVREKLRQAQENNSDGRYDANIKALEKIIPMDIPSHLIEFTIGSSWVDPKLYSDYVKERTNIDVTFTSAGGTWIMQAPSWVNEQANRAFGVVSEMFHKTILGTQLIEAAMQNKTITVSETRKNWDGTKETVTDKDATQACAAKIDEIRQDFKDWAKGKMQSDPEMSQRMERVYNDIFNNYVPMEIPDDFVPDYFSGASHSIKLEPHQGKAAVRGTTQPLLLAHEVGAGKTFTLITTAMEMRRLGTAKKPMIVVQNATVGQFVESAKELYPSAKVLTIEEADRTAEGRKNFYAKIKYNDWDLIIVPQSVFERIPDSEERQMAFVKDKIDEKMLVLYQMQESDNGNNSTIVRQAENEISKLEDQLAALSDAIAEKRKKRDEKKEAIVKQNTEVKALEMLDRQTDDVENFDDMGIDAILVDEAHEYKHLGFATAMQRGVKGVDPSYSKKSQGVFLKTQAVLEKNNGRNVVFATGTPISNTAAEIWTFMRYLMPADTMKQYGIYYFDDFVRNFGNLQQMLEFTTSGKFKENNRFAGYVNLPELIRIWSGVADTVLTTDIEKERVKKGKESKIPEMEGGKAQDIYLPQTRALRSIMKFVKRELERFENMTGKDKKKNSHIPLVMYGIAKAAAVDARLVDAEAEDDPNSKTNEAVRQTLKSLEESKDYRGTVAIFADNYQNKASGFNLYEDIKQKLVDAGVPEDQIVVMKSGMSIKKKLEIFDKMNRGEVRVMLGSTFTLGTGVNIQERLYTLIHLDAPNRPMDYTQRNGRILRQGNLHKIWNKAVNVLRFGVEDSLDVTAYQRLKTKGAIADSIMNGKAMMANSMENRVLEEEEDVFGDTVAQLSGSEYAMLKNQAEKDVRKYEAKRKQYEADQTYIHNQIPRLENSNKEAEASIRIAKASLEKLKSMPEKPKITIGKNTFGSVEEMADFIKEYNIDLRKTEDDIRGSVHNVERKLTINVGGIDFIINVSLRPDMEMKNGKMAHVVRRNMTYSCPDLGLEDVPVRQMLLRNAIEDIMTNAITGKDAREEIESSEETIKKNTEVIVQLKERDGKPFANEDDLKQAKERLAEYTDAMKKEMAEKEAKYAEMDAEVEMATGVTEAQEAEEETDEGEELYRDEETQGGVDIEQASKVANDTIKKLGLQDRVTILDSTEGLTGKRKTTKGWFDTKTGKIVIVMPNHRDPRDVVKTILHEGVAHYGLRKLVGDENINRFLDKVFENASEEVRSSIIDLAMDKYDRNFRKATEEYLAGLAEDTNFENPSWLAKVKVWFVEMLHKLGIDIGTGNGGLTDNELRYLLWKSYRNLVADADSLTEIARDAVMQSELDVGNYAPAVAAESMAREKNDDDFDPDDNGGGITPEQDAAYMDAVNRGDMETAQRMVMEAAKAAMPNTKVVDENGNPKVVLHGTPNTFTVFDEGLVGSHNDAGWLGTGFYFYGNNRVYAAGYAQGGPIMAVFLNIENPYYASNEEFEHLAEMDDIAESMGFTEDRKEDGFDGVFYNGDLNEEWVAYYPNQIKSADPVTYDDQGNVIPLSQRFNEEEDDIRFRDAEPANKVRDKFDEISWAHPKDKAETLRQKIETFLTNQVNKFRPLKQLEELMAKTLGRNVRDSEAVYSRATQMAGRTLAQMEAEREAYLTPLSQAVNEVLDIIDPEGRRAKRNASLHGFKYEAMEEVRQQLSDYLIAKHGLERSEWFYQQKLAEFEEKKKDPAWMAAQQAKYDALSDDKKASMTFDEYIENKKPKWKDMGGLTGLAESLGEDTKKHKQVAENLVKEFEKKIGKEAIGKLWGAINDFNNRNLEIQYESGRKTKEEYDELKARHQYYVPLTGFDDETSDDRYTYEGNVQTLGDGLYRAKGRRSKPADPLVAMMHQQEHDVIWSNDNWSKDALLNAAINMKSDLLSVSQSWYVYNDETEEWEERLPEVDDTMSADKRDAVIKQFEADMKDLQSKKKAKRHRGRLNVGVRVLPKRESQHEVEVWRGGRRYIVYVNGNPSVVRAYSESQKELDNFTKGLAKANRIEAQLFTTYNPEFAVKNMMRDTNFALFSAYVLGGRKQWWETRKNIDLSRRVLPHLMKDGMVSEKQVKDPAERQQLEQWYKEFIENGGETGFTRMMSAEQMSKDLNETLFELVTNGKNAITKVQELGEKVQTLNRWAENSTRFAAYITARQNGETVRKSMDMAKNSTLNFNIKGYEGKRLRAWFAFFNARLQGVAQLARLAKQNPKRFAIGIGAAVLTGAMVPFLNVLLLGFFGDDDDWRTYENLSEYAGNNNLILFFPGIHKFIQIPYSQELAPFSAIGNIWFREAMGWNRNKSAWQQELEMALAYLPMEVSLSDKEDNSDWWLSTLARTASPTILQPTVEYLVNENFMNMPLRRDSKYKNDLAAWTRAYENRTSSALINASKWLNGGGSKNKWGKFEFLIDPSFIQHVVEGTAGGAGSFIGNARDLFTEPDWFNHLPFVRKFMFDSAPKKWQAGLDRAYSSYAYDLVEKYDGEIDAIRNDNNLSKLEYARRMWEENNTTEAELYNTAKYYRDELGKYQVTENGHRVNKSEFGYNQYRKKDNGVDDLPIIGIKGMRQYYGDLRAHDADNETIEEWRNRINEYEMQMIEEMDAVYYRERVLNGKSAANWVQRMVDKARGRDEDWWKEYVE